MTGHGRRDVVRTARPTKEFPATRRSAIFTPSPIYRLLAGRLINSAKASASEVNPSSAGTAGILGVLPFWRPIWLIPMILFELRLGR